MQAFAKYLDDSNLSCTDFAELLDVEDSTVWRWRYGTGSQKRSPSLALALKIEALTNGAVPVSSWAHDTSKDSAATSRKGPAQGGAVRRSTGRKPSRSSHRR